MHEVGASFIDRGKMKKTETKSKSRLSPGHGFAPIIPAAGRLPCDDCRRFEVSLDYRVNPSLSYYVRPCRKQNKAEKEQADHFKATFLGKAAT